MEWLWLIVLAPLCIFLVYSLVLGIRDKDEPEPINPWVPVYNKRNDHRQQHYEWDLEYYQLCGQSVYTDIHNPKELNSLQEQWDKTFLSANELHELARMERDNQLPT